MRAPRSRGAYHERRCALRAAGVPDLGMVSEPGPVRIAPLGPDSAPLVFDTVLALLRELGDEAEDLKSFDAVRVLAAWRERGEGFRVLGAFDTGHALVGLLTLSEAFAIYAGGPYGVIDEMYVLPAWRSRGIGRLLVAEAKAIGRQRGWQRLDVTAPESERWSATRRFYEREGFTFTGPKLKYVLD